MISAENSNPSEVAYQKAMHLEKMKRQAKINAINAGKKKWRRYMIKKWSKTIAIVAAIGFGITVLIFPSRSGIIIGQWINQFFGNIVKESIK